MSAPRAGPSNGRRARWLRWLWIALLVVAVLAFALTTWIASLPEDYF